MGIVPKVDIQRDQDLIKDYLLQEDGYWKYTITQLGVKYGRVDEKGIVYPLTSTRIHQILKKYKVEKKRTSNRNF